MSLRLPTEEPEAGPWRAASTEQILHRVVTDPRGGAVLAIDGRGASGKSTLAEALADSGPGAVIVHTDDLAWHEPMFGWGHLLHDEILVPFRVATAISFHPPQWRARGREGRIEVPSGSPLLIVEGTGASQRAHTDLVDGSIWVQADAAMAEQRGIDRDVESGVNGNRAEATRFWQEWMAHEIPFLADERPWERADLVVAGHPVIDLGPGEFAVATGPGVRSLPSPSATRADTVEP